MNDTRKRRFERYARCVGFTDERAADFPAETARGKSAAGLKALLAEIEKLDAESATHVRLKQQGTSSKHDEREVLRRLINTISNTAEVASYDHPEIKDAFRRPKANSNDQTLLATARSFAAAAVPYKTLFAEYDLPADILEKFNTGISNFEEATSRKERGASAKASADAAIEDAFRRADLELDRLDTFVHNKFGEDPATMAAWDRARRLERPRHSKNGRGRNGGDNGEKSDPPHDETKG